MLLSGTLMLYRHQMLAQSAQRPRIGFLRPAPPPEAVLDAFRRALGEHGLIPSESCELVFRWGDGNAEHLTRLAAELVNEGWL